MSRSGRRHYRVAQKEVESCTTSNKICKNKKKYIAVACILLTASFIKGGVFGYLLGRKS